MARKRKKAVEPAVVPARSWKFRLDPAQASQLVGVAAAMIVVLLVNVVSTRRFTRWDFTANKRYSLSAATTQTLRTLPEPIQIWVLLGSSDPLEQSVKQLLVAYKAETTKLDVRYVDPDHDTAALEDVKKRFKIETGRTQEGHVIADAIVVVARGDKHWFLTGADMFEASADDTRVKPREEQALTGAIRNVLGGEKTKICFVAGHGEMAVSDGSERGVGLFAEVLGKDNFDVSTVDVSVPGGSGTPLAGCSVAIVAGLRSGFTKEEAERVRTWLLGGGNLLVAASPIAGDTPSGIVPAGLERVLAPFGVALDDDLVIEEDAALAFSGAGGIRFEALAKQHAVTAGLVKADGRGDSPRVVLHFARSMHKTTEPGSANPVDLLVTTAKSFGLTSIAGASEWKETPSKRPGDLGGPLVVAMASERPKVEASAAHGPRLVVVGSASALTATSFREPLGVRGAALLVESAVSWLASKPQVLDVPERAAIPAGIRITDDSRSEIRRYVLLFMPATVALLGIAIALWRRAGEGAPRKKRGKAA